MGTSKSEQFTDNQNKLAGWAKALSHPARIAIIQILSERDTCVCGDLVDVLPLSQSTISQHLAELKKAGLITGTISGPSTCYCIDVDGWANAQQAIGSFMEVTVNKNECC